MMQKEAVKKFVHDLCNLYVPFFDVERNETIGRTPLAFSAVYKRRDERYMFTKKVKVWGVENQQIIFAAAPDQPISMSFVHQMIEDMQVSMKEFLPEHQEHMSTVFTAIIITDQPVDKETIQWVSKFRKVKFLKYGMHGWAEMYLSILEVPKRNIHIHKKGKPFIEPVQTFIEGGAT